MKMPVELPTTSVVLDLKSPKEKRTLWASVFGAGVFCSTDGGATWVAKNNGLDPGGDKRCLRVTLHKDGTLFVATTGKIKKSTVGTGLYRSTDRGENWTLITAGQPWDWINDYMVNPNDSQTVLLPTSRVDAGLHRTTDGGKTWQTIYQEPNQNYYDHVTYHPSHPSWIYLNVPGGREASLFLSKDDGHTWLPFKQIPFGCIQRICFDPDDPKHMYLSAFGASIIKAPVEP